MNKQNKWLTHLKIVFDVMFIMLLCFSTLLATMLLQGGLLVGGEGIQYDFNLVSFLITFVSLAGYVIYILKNSDKELKIIINRMYTNQ